jgi:hypothetical protein
MFSCSVLFLLLLSSTPTVWACTRVGTNPSPLEPESHIDRQTSISSSTTAPVNCNATLLNIVLVATIDGNLHALNRSSGDVKWSLASANTFSKLNRPVELEPVVKSSDTYLTDNIYTNHSAYIVEPGSGALYFKRPLHTTLIKLPHSVSELASLAPLEMEHPFLVGSPNTTSLVQSGSIERSYFTLDIKTGKLRDIFQKTCSTQPDPTGVTLQRTGQCPINRC